jgi:hypothetical protein
MKIDIEKMYRVKMMPNTITPNIRMEEFDALVDALAEAKEIITDLNKSIPDFMQNRTRSGMWLLKWFKEGNK